MQIHKSSIFTIFFLLVALFSSCKSTKEVQTFENVLYPDGRFFVVKQQDEFAKRRFDFYFLEANRLKMLGDMGNSAMYYTEALKIDSTCATCYYEIGNLLVQNKEFAEAEKFIFNSVKYDPTNPHFLLLLSKLYLHNNKPELGLKSAIYLTQQNPDKIEYLYYLAQNQANAGKTNDAIKTLNKVQTLIGLNEFLSLEKHSVLVEGGDIKGAERELLSLINAYSNEAMYRVYLGDFYTQQQQLPKAFEQYNKALDIDQNNGAVQFSLANYYYLSNDSANFFNSLKKGFANHNLDLDLKIQRLLPMLVNIEEQGSSMDSTVLNDFFNLLIEAHPQESQIYTLYGNYLRHLELDSLALNAFETSLLIDESQEELWQEFLILGFASFSNEDAIKFSNQAISIFPENGLFYYLNGFSNMIIKDYDTAILSLEKAGELVIGNKVLQSQIYGMLGDIYYQQKNPEKSFANYDKSLSINEDNIVILNNYAYYLTLEKQQLDKAEYMIRRVIEEEPSNPTYLDTYAWVLFKRGNYIEALFVIEQAITNGGDSNGVILEHYGDILFKNDDIDNALKYWQLASESEDEVSESLPKKIMQKKYIP